MKTFGFLKDDQAGSISIARFDLSIFIERDIPFAVMHRSRRSLVDISECTGLVVEPLLGDDGGDALRVRGSYCNNPELMTDSVWVKASSNKYRKALEERNFNAGLIDSRLPSALHADHVVNRASLKALIQEGHEPWVLMFEVPSSANTNFGVNYEKHLPAFSPDTGQLHLTPAHIFKLYTTDWPKTHAEFEMSLSHISNQVKNQNVIQLIRKEFEKKFQ